MVRSSLLFTTVLGLATSVLAAPAARPILYLAGDSTMVATGDGKGTAGWGKLLPDYMNITIVNEAIAGRSARSYTREGRFNTIASQVKCGDYVIIEFGHNDGGGSPKAGSDNGRQDCNPGSGPNGYAATCQTTYNGTAETVLTFEAYIFNAAKLLESKGAIVIISSLTPDNPWESGTFTYTPSRFVTYDKDAAKTSKSTFVDHGQATANAYKAAGAKTVDGYYPYDHTHTSPAGAKVVAHAFVTALENTTSTLKHYVI